MPACYRCKGWTYPGDPKKEGGRWCLMCGEWIAPLGWEPLPYLSRLNMANSHQWAINSFGDIVDVIDTKIEELVQRGGIVTVTAASRYATCSTSEARISLDKLYKNKQVTFFRYGPQNRWNGYQKI